MIADTQDAILSAQAEIMEIFAEIKREMMQDTVTRQARALWQATPQQLKEVFKREKPDEYRALMREISNKE